MKGFTLLPVVLAMSLVATTAFLLNRDNGVHAHLVGAQSDRERARYAAEAGLQAVNYAIQANACAGGYPLSASPVSDSNFGGATYSAHANNSSGSPLTLTSTGTYNGASVTVSRTNAYVYQSGIRTWVTQPGPATSKDASVDEDHPTDNYGGDRLLEIEATKKQILIAFDLSPLPPGSRIVRWYEILGAQLRPGAVISLYQDSAGAQNNFAVKLITQEWLPGTRNGTTPTAGNPGATWRRWNGLVPYTWANGFGNGYDPRTLLVVPQPGSIGWVDIDVSAAAAGWTSSVYPNYGVWLVPFGNTRSYKFVSANEASAQAARRPKLTASYLLPCGASAPA